jgi:hypothetical protein
MAFASSALALTAVCRNPVGRVLGVHGAFGEGKQIDAVDGMPGGLFTFVRERGERRVQVISQGTGGGAPMTDTGIQVFSSSEQTSFLVVYPSAVWMYSLYEKPRMLLISVHNNGVSIDSGGAVVKTYRANCEFSEK